MLKRPHYIALGVVMFITFTLLKLPSRATANLKLAISGLFLPVHGLAHSTENAVTSSSYAAIPRSELLHQIDTLQREKQEPKRRLIQADEALRENARLRDLFNITRQYPWKFRAARVVSRDPANWWRTIRIDLGARDGVRTNAPVLTAEGLVGRIH